MDRRTVLQSLMSSLAIGITPPLSGEPAGTEPTSEGQKEGLIVHLGENRNRAGFSVQHCLISGRDTGGALAINGPGSLSNNIGEGPTTADGNTAGQNAGPPLHVHYAQDEFWYVFDGELLVQVGDQRFHVQRGDMVMGPRGVPHTFRALKHPSAVLTMWQPAGTMEEFFHESALAHQKAGGKPDEAVIAALFKAHGMEVVGPPIQA